MEQISSSHIIFSNINGKTDYLQKKFYSSNKKGESHINLISNKSLIIEDKLYNISLCIQDKKITVKLTDLKQKKDISKQITIEELDKKDLINSKISISKKKQISPIFDESIKIESKLYYIFVYIQDKKIKLILSNSTQNKSVSKEISIPRKNYRKQKNTRKSVSKNIIKKKKTLK